MVRTTTTVLTIVLAGVPSIAQTPQPPAEPCAPAAAPAVGVDSTTALLLVGRIQTILDEAVKNESSTSVTAVGSSGTKDAKAADGRIRIERSLVDEIRAELGQIRTLIKK